RIPMTKRKGFKKRVREHMSKTGKAYTAARGDLESKAARKSLTFRKFKFECFRIEKGAKRRVAQGTLRYAVERDIRSVRREDWSGTRGWIHTLPLVEGFAIAHNTLMTARGGAYSSGFCFRVEQPGLMPSLEWFTPLKGNVFHGPGRVQLTVAKRAEHQGG